LIEKRGQVTIFIILGIIVLAIFSFIFLFVYQEKVTTIEDQSEIITQTIQIDDSVKLFIEKCFEDTFNQAIFENSYNGGYFFLPTESTTNLTYNVPYYLLNNNSKIINISEIEKQLGYYIESMAPLCLNDFKKFTSIGFNITSGTIQSDIKITNESIKLDVIFPVKIRLQESIKELNKFEIEIQNNQLLRSLELNKEIIKSQQGEQVCLTCFSRLKSDNNFTMNIFSEKNNTLVLEIINHDYLINNKELVSRFAIKNE